MEGDEPCKFCIWVLCLGNFSETFSSSAISLLPNVTHAHISGGTYNAVGRDINNHFYNNRPGSSSLASSDAWLIPSYHDILADALDKAAEGTGEHVINSSLFRGWTTSGDSRMLWGTGIRESVFESSGPFGLTCHSSGCGEDHAGVSDRCLS